jgi:serine/threonine protein kinase
VISGTISHYRILNKLGAGGMGEVYLAEDTRLGRKVALKLLPESLIADDQAKRRFVQEARAASALNHPHIITIYDITSDDHRDFIVMEYVEGETLRDVLSHGRIDTKRALEMVTQVASGLAAAHEAGIVHRDIKPENLMVTRAGQIKILDFGLAKLIEKQRAALVTSDLTAATCPKPAPPAETEAGTIMGTVAYMSPEQAEGRPLDHRTDIFSLGAVLYELLTGQRPFEGKSAIDTLHAIINDEPRPVVELNQKLPVEVTDTLSKAMAKDVTERYRHAGDLELDLRRLKRGIETNSLPSAKLHPAQSAVGPRAWWATGKALSMWAAIGALVIIAVAFTAWMLGRSTASPTRAVSVENITVTPLTTDPGYEGEPTFSPDDQTIAYVSDRTGNFEIFLKQVSGGPDINITNNAADDVQPSFSPDGKQIAFVSSRSGSSSLHYPNIDSPMMGGSIWVMTAHGGNVRRIAESGNFPSWSRDGSSIIYVSGPWFNHKIYSVAATGGDAREIPINFRSDQAAPPRLLFPSYSSDGRWIVFWSQNTIHVVSAEGGETRPIAKGIYPVWSADSRAIIYSSAETGKNLTLWRVPFSLVEGNVSGSPEPLTIGRGRDVESTVSRDGKLIAFTARDVSFNVELMPFDAETGRPTGDPQPITKGSEVIHFLNSSPDGRSIVFESHRGASSHIWRVDLGSVAVQLTSDPDFDDHYPRWSPDGHTIAFNRQPTKALQAQSSLWLMREDGANPQPLIEKAESSAWMPDGHALVYLSAVDRQLYLLDLVTKIARRLIDEPRVMPIFTVSPDGKWVLYQSTISGNVDLRAVPIDGGPSSVVVDTPRQDYHPSFSPSGKWLYFQPDHKNLYRMPGPAQGWRKSEPKKVTNFPESGLFLEDPQVSRDGHWLLYSRGHVTADIWIMKLGQ